MPEFTTTLEDERGNVDAWLYGDSDRRSVESLVDALDDGFDRNSDLARL